MSVSYARKYPFHRLVGSETAIVVGTQRAATLLGEPGMSIHSTALGRLGETLPHLNAFSGVREQARADIDNLAGAGVGNDDESAWVRCVVEAVERYCMLVHHPDELEVATANELGTDAIDLDLLPRCSERELGAASCPLRPAGKDDSIRWVGGVSLSTGRRVYVPAIMSHLYLQPLPGERFWQQVSTGVAAHTDLFTALVSAACEMIERDAITLTWLGRLPLAEIDVADARSSGLLEAIARVRASSVEHRFFDATTDLGIPTVFAVQSSPHAEQTRLVVSCATSIDAEAAAAKTIWEASSMRVAMRNEAQLPDDIADFTALHHGATFYARRGADDAFAFLLRPATPKTLGQVRQQALEGLSPRNQLHVIVERLRAHGLDAVAVDLTTEEVREAGLWVVRVLIPGLLPLVTLHRARMLGTPRLYDYVSKMRGEPFHERDVNPDPMPFA